MQGQAFDGGHVVEFDAEQAKAVGLDMARHIAADRQRQLDAALAGLDRQFPGHHDADQDFVVRIGDAGLGPRRQFVVAFHPAQEGIRVEQRNHPV
jgi:hypothetical protein